MFNLTPQERRVILFLITIALMGMGINFLRKINPGIKRLAYFEQNIAKIDLNKADKELLMSAPGIAGKLAQRIIDYRKQKGSFSDIEELKNIRGITNYRYKKIKDSFIVQ